MIYPVYHIKYVTVVTLIASILFLASDKSTARASDSARQDETRTETVDLKECIEIAFENNLQLAVARNRLGIADADCIKASLLLPSNPEVRTELGARESSSERHTGHTIALSQEKEVFI